MQKGVIGYYNDEKGFGFIKVEGQEKDTFFHFSVKANPDWNPQKGEEVMFELSDEDAQAGRGPKAAKVVLASEADEMEMETEEEMM